LISLRRRRPLGRRRGKVGRRRVKGWEPGKSLLGFGGKT